MKEILSTYLTLTNYQKPLVVPCPFPGTAARLLLLILRRFRTTEGNAITRISFLNTSKSEMSNFNHKLLISKPNPEQTSSSSQNVDKNKSNQWCVVPQCSSNSESTPNKLLICVPHDVEIRKKWLKLANIQDEELLEISPIFFCEDHFNLSEDMENYTQHKVLCTRRADKYSPWLCTMDNVIMKPDCLPSKFECQLKTPQGKVHEKNIPISENRNKNSPINIVDDDDSSNDEKAVDNVKRNISIIKVQSGHNKNICNSESKNKNCPIRTMDIDDSSNDVEAVENVEQDCNLLDISEERPIMLLFGRLIGNDNKQNTVLTNAQIILILQEEFKMDIKGLHELELDIYLTVTKKFLKDWPQWDDFDRIVTGLKNIGANDSVKKILDKKYKHLKEYLNVMLEETKKHTDVVMEDILQEDKEDDTVALEVCCTRSQLNQLIFQTPRPDMNNTIFNVTDSVPSRIVFNSFNMETILNWWAIKVNINLNVLTYRRQTVHEVKRMIINNKIRNNKKVINKALPQDMQFKAGKKTSKCKKDKIMELLDRILLQYINNIEVYYLIETIFNLLKNDLKDAPNWVLVPATYKKYNSKYKYKRYLNADSNTFSKTSDKAKYDLQLEETVSPMHEFYIGKVCTLNSLLPPFSDWFNIECVMCNIKFSGAKLMDSFKEHFNDNHMNEPDWTCTNCNQSFFAPHLAEKNWSHSC